MSNINLILSNAIGAARGDRAACAAGLVDGIYRAYIQFARHGQKTPFLSGRNAAERWRGELGSSILTAILRYYDEARAVQESRAKLTSADLASIEGSIAADVAGAYAQEAARAEAKKAESKAKREAAKLVAEKAAEKAALEEAADVLRWEGEVSSVRTLLDRTTQERDTLAAALAAAHVQIDALKAELAKVAPVRKAKAKAATTEARARAATPATPSTPSRARIRKASSPGADAPA